MLLYSSSKNQIYFSNIQMIKYELVKIIAS